MAIFGGSARIASCTGRGGGLQRSGFFWQSLCWRQARKACAARTTRRPKARRFLITARDPASASWSMSAIRSADRAAPNQDAGRTARGRIHRQSPGRARIGNAGAAHDHQRRCRRGGGKFLRCALAVARRQGGSFRTLRSSLL